MAKENSRSNAGGSRRKSNESVDGESDNQQSIGQGSGVDNASQDDASTPRPNARLDQRPPAAQPAATPATSSPAVDPSLKKPSKRVAKNARPIAQKSASYYEKGALEPSGMTKKESDTCLTCLRYCKRCKGTKLVMVKGVKRCECCANPGTGTSGRVCYWRDPKRGIHTYEDGQRILGGRTIAKNTRQGRQKRQAKAEGADDAQDSSDEDDIKQEKQAVDKSKDEAEDDNDEDGEEQDETYDQVDSIDDDLRNAAGSAYASLQQMVAQDLDLLVGGANYTMADLAVERALRDAFNGSGPHLEYLEGIAPEILALVRTMVESNIADMEGGLGHH